MMGMARFLKGKTEIDLAEISMAFRVGMEDIMKKAGSKPGEKLCWMHLTRPLLL